MNTFGRYSTIALLTLASAFLVPSAALGGSALVDSTGQVFSVKAGEFGDLFAGEKTCASDETVLALDRHRPSGAFERVLVPGTCNAEAEISPSILYDGSSNTLFLLWESRLAEGSSRIFLSYLEGESWAEGLEITEGAVSLEGSPRLVSTRDQISLSQANGSLRDADRRILHIVWSQASPGDGRETMYAPVILVDGSFLGRIPKLSLEDLPTGSFQKVNGVSGSLAQPELVEGADDNSVVIGFLHGDLQRLVAIEVRQLPGILSSMAQGAAQLTEEIGSSLLNRPGGIESLARQVSSSILEDDSGLHVGVRAFLAAETERVILEEALESVGPGIPIDLLAGTVGARFIEQGSRFFGTDGLDRIYEDDRLAVIAISGAGSEEADQAALADMQHLLRFYAVSNLPLPDLEGRDVTFLASSSGENGLLCWQEGPAEIRYQENQGQAWGPVRSLPLSAGFSYEQIQQILRERVEKR